jgi:hypothetical protein
MLITYRVTLVLIAASSWALPSSRVLDVLLSGIISAIALRLLVLVISKKNWFGDLRSHYTVRGELIAAFTFASLGAFLFVDGDPKRLASTFVAGALFFTESAIKLWSCHRSAN